MDTLKIRAYNVLFGDALLVTVPDADSDGNPLDRHILIDVGNALRNGGRNDVFDEVVKDIIQQLNDKPLDLYVMTHEHMDHVQGLPYAEDKIYKKSDYELRDLLKPQYAWFPISSQPNYFEAKTRTEAKLHFEAIKATMTRLGQYFQALEDSEAPIDESIEMLWAINNIGHTEDLVAYLKELVPNPSYICRGLPTQGLHPFQVAEFEIWAPEQEVGVYFSSLPLRPLNLEIPEISEKEEKPPSLVPVIPPGGVDAGAFYKLVASRRGILENLLAANGSINNTSIVFCLKWQGYRLLFTGDAEVESWQKMEEAKILKDVHFLKVSHHGSKNGTPHEDILKVLLPNKSDAGRPRHALVSSIKGAYHGTIPDEPTLHRISDLCEKLHIMHDETEPGKYLDIEFPA